MSLENFLSSFIKFYVKLNLMLEFSYLLAVTLKLKNADLAGICANKHIIFRFLML